jgi:CheY-like chemotaxis protein
MLSALSTSRDSIRPPAPSATTILVVEDDADVQDVVVRYLADQGYRVLTAADGETALAILRGSETIDLLLADIVMPGLDGVQLARKAKQMHPGIKVLFTTGYAQRAAERDAMRYGRLLFKPVRHPELTREVEALLAGG